MKNSFNIALCDDSLDFIWIIYEKVREIMDKTEYEYNIEDFDSAEELIEALNENWIDIILLDIEMPKISGFEVSDIIRKQQKSAEIIFVTSHSELAYQAYDYHPYQFVCKNDLNRLDYVFAGVCRKIIYKRSLENMVMININGVFEVDVKEIKYIKSRKNYVVFCYADGTEKLYRAKLKEVYDALKEKGFLYIQRSYVVNCRFINDFDTKKVVLKNGEIISVTRDYQTRHEAQKKYGEFLRRLR